MNSVTIRRLVPVLLVACPLSGVSAQVVQSPDPDLTRLSSQPGKEAEPDWQFRVGGGVALEPRFLGSKDYVASPVPFVEIRYKSRLFLSVFDGLGYDIVQTGHFRAGPVVKFAAARKESDAGSSHALKGLGDISATAEAGGYMEYQWHDFVAKAELRKAIGGSKGIVGNIGVRYNKRFSVPYSKLPAIISIGPRTTFVNSKSNQAFFGITSLQSTNSGLPIYTAKGGLQSYGAGATTLLPVTNRISATLIAGYDRYTGDAANSPLVVQRGSKNQALVGLGLIYRFGL
jgi:outer membrane protein